MAIFTTSQTNGFSFGPFANITNIIAAGVTVSDTANDAAFTRPDRFASRQLRQPPLQRSRQIRGRVRYGRRRQFHVQWFNGVISGITAIRVNGDNDSLINNDPSTASLWDTP